MTHRHPAFAAPKQPKWLDKSPNALTQEESDAVKYALQCGYTPRAGLIRKMLRLSLQSSDAYQAGVDWASGKLSVDDEPTVPVEQLCGVTNMHRGSDAPIPTLVVNRSEWP